MIYNNTNTIIPQEKRKEINDKILFLINSNTAEQYNITKEVIYNSYTGDGGLSGINYKDYNSFYEYTKAKQEFENGQFFTPHYICEYIVSILNIKEHSNIIDITCGSGNFYNFISKDNQIFGNEIDSKAYTVCKYLYPHINLTLGDMKDYRNSIKMDYVIGNPPFNIDNSQFTYIKKATELLKHGGILCIIVPYTFMMDEFSEKKYIDYMNENYNFIGQQELKADTFKNVGVSNFKTKIMCFSYNSEHITNNNYKPIFTDNLQECINNYYETFKSVKNKIILENRHEKNIDAEFEFKTNKLLFDIKRNVGSRYFECSNYLNQYLTQKKPDNVNQETWDKIKLTKYKVLRYFKQVLSEQHGKKWGKKHITGRKVDKIQQIPFDELKINPEIDDFLKLPFNGIQLNPVQLEIVNKMLQKRYGYIQSSQGTGKTLMSIYYARYRNCRNTLVIAPSIAINTTWRETLKKYKLPFTQINSMSSVGSIKDGDFIIISFEMLVKYGKLLKKRLHNNTCLILDEADSIATPTSKRTKAVLNVCSRLKYKLLLSGTMTRNNITEAYTQFLLMYGKSYNWISNNEYILSENKEKELIKKINPYYNKPYPHYLKGYTLFQESFNPRKVTVFGAEQNTQDVFNPDELKELINRSIITKTFEEVVGKDLYTIHQHNIKMNKAEEALYEKAIKEFYSMKHLFNSTGNPRKDRMLEIIQQITLLLNICKHPNTYAEYMSDEIPNKYKKVVELIKKWNGKNIAIGTRSLKEVEEYSKLLKSLNCKFYVVTGATSMNKRLEIIEELRADKSAILLSTQQALSVSVDIEFIDKVIITSLSWNYSTLAQYFFRFVRYNSINNKEIHIITYANSIENNLLYLISKKEKLTNFMKNNEESEDSILDRLGVGYNLIDNLLIKSRLNEKKVVDK